MMIIKLDLKINNTAKLGTEHDLVTTPDEFMKKSARDKLLFEVDVFIS